MLNKKTICFRSDADSKIGFGHFTRTLALADILKSYFECVFYTQTPTVYQKTEVSKVCKLVELPSDDSKFDLFLKMLKGDEIVFLDNYFFSPDYEKKIKEIGCKLVTISPNGRHHYADVLLNMGDDDLSKFDVESYTRICRGIEWTILRSAFLTKLPEFDRKRNSFVVCFGGTDQFQITEKVVETLQVYIPDNEIHVISTSLISEDRIKNLKQRNCYMHINVSAEEVSSIFDTCEAAILSTSTVAIEALSRGILVYAGYYVDNQYKFCNYLTDKGYINNLGCLLDKKMTDRLMASIQGGLKVKKKIPDGLFATKEKYIELFQSI